MRIGSRRHTWQVPAATATTTRLCPNAYKLNLLLCIDGRKTRHERRGSIGHVKLTLFKGGGGQHTQPTNATRTDFAYIASCTPRPIKTPRNDATIETSTTYLISSSLYTTLRINQFKSTPPAHPSFTSLPSYMFTFFV